MSRQEPPPLPPPVSTVTRQRARSGVGYAEDVVLHETKERRIMLRPWYIPHQTQPHGLAVKLIVQRPRNFGLWADDNDIYLNEEAVLRLRSALDEHRAVARSGEDGQFLLIRSAGLTATGDAEPAELVGAMVRLFRRRDVLEHFAHEHLDVEILAALRSSIRLQELGAAVNQLRELLESGAVEERHYQDWCERHAWAFGNAHTAPDDIRRLNRTDDVDILLPRVLTGYRDIVELKRPDHPVLVHDKSRGTVYWSVPATQAIAQCHEYIEHLQADAERGLRGRPDIVASHPRATIVIGRSVGWDDAMYRVLAGLNNRLVGITLMTYDQLLAQGEELVRLFTAEAEEPAPPGLDPDDIPF
jgi:hypothetical protein